MKIWLDFVAPNPDRAALRGTWQQAGQVWQADNPAQVAPVLQAVEHAAQRGMWCVGYLRFEAAAAFDPAFVLHPADGPLAWFAALEPPVTSTAEALPTCHSVPQADAEVLATWQDHLARSDFDAAMAAIHGAIASGRYYQINYTHVGTGRLERGTPEALFAALRRAQGGGYAAYIDTGAEQVLSVSPELFFDWDGERLLTRPMKGTAARGATPAADAAQAQALQTSAKERAENVMIVDLLRNDVARIAQAHSVQVPRLFDCHALPSVWQMTSDVTARTRAGTGLLDVFAALFPCGSVTGAPKIEALRHIHALEAGPRGPYCGAIGVVRPAALPGQVQATFNVAIRTVVARPQGNATQLFCGIGSGITADASADGEWQEWRHKRAFLQRASAPFELLETLALELGQLRHAAAHVQRMGLAAAHFAYPFDAAAAAQALATAAQQHPDGAWRVRLLCNAAGRISVQAFALAPTQVPVRLQLAPRCFEAADSEFVRFKTTQRSHYAVFEPQQPEVFDTLLWNARGELTECTRGNIALQLDGRWWTPPLAAGLLGGIGRQFWLEQGRLHEASLRIEDVARAQGVAFINSLRGWLPAVVEL